MDFWVKCKACLMIKDTVEVNEADSDANDLVSITVINASDDDHEINIISDSPLNL